MPRVIIYDEAAGTAAAGGMELVEQWRESDGTTIWVDLGPGDDAVDVLASFSIDELAIQDAMRTRHPPKVEQYENYLFVLYRGLDADTVGIDYGSIQLSQFIADRFLLTYHNKSSVSSNAVFAAVQSNPSLMADGPVGVALLMANRLTRRYVEILLDLEPRLDEIEAEMFAQPNDALLAELTSYKSRLRNLARIARYHEHIARELRHRVGGFIDDSFEHNVNDLYEQIERTQSLSTLYYELCVDLTDGYLAMSSHRLNRVMQVLTVITVIFVPLTFLAGIYGMNFAHMPELSSENGYFAVLIVMGVAALTQLVYFRRKKWV